MDQMDDEENDDGWIGYFWIGCLVICMSLYLIWNLLKFLVTG